MTAGGDAQASDVGAHACPTNLESSGDSLSSGSLRRPDCGGRAGPADLQPCRQSLGQLAHVRDDADHAVAAVEGVQRADDHVEGVGVQGAEAFVEEEALEGVGGAGFGA